MNRLWRFLLFPSLTARSRPQRAELQKGGARSRPRRAELQKQGAHSRPLRVELHGDGAELQRLTVRQEPAGPRELPEFAEVNRLAGIEPLQSELSGLNLRSPAGIPRRLTQLRVPLAYRWQPSGEYRRRQDDIRRTNSWIERKLRRPGVLPPILLFPEDQDIAPHRLQTYLDQQTPGHPFSAGQLPLDLGAVDRAVKLQVVPTIEPVIPEMDPEYFAAYRHLLPREYRRFLRHSPYPRIGAGLLAAGMAVVGFLWITQLQHAEAVAAGRARAARSAFQAELDAARAYGADPRKLLPLQQRSRRLETASQPAGLLIDRGRLAFLLNQAARYSDLLGELRRLDRRAFAYWTWREGITYAALVDAKQGAAAAGLQANIGTIPACDTPRCFRQAVQGQERQVTWLGQTTATLRVYGAEILQSPDPARATTREIQRLRNLAAVVPATGLPAPLKRLDDSYASAISPADEAQVGALARLDADALEQRLVQRLPGRSIVVSVEDQRMTCYVNGKAVYSSAVTTDPSVPTGVFHIQDKEASIAATYWRRSGRRYRYRYGSIPDWLAFSGGSALQGAPWQVFGPGSSSVLPAWAPSTPGSIDLPPASAAFLYGWAPLGGEVVIW